MSNNFISTVPTSFDTPPSIITPHCLDSTVCSLHHSSFHSFPINPWASTISTTILTVYHTNPPPSHVYSGSVPIPYTLTMLSVFRLGRSRKQNRTILAAAALTSCEKLDSQSVRNTSRQWIMEQLRGAVCHPATPAPGQWRVRELVFQSVSRLSRRLVSWRSSQGS